MLFIGFCIVLIIAFILDLRVIDKIGKEIEKEFSIPMKNDNKMEV